MAGSDDNGVRQWMDKSTFKYLFPGTKESYQGFANGNWGPSVDSIPIIGDIKHSMFDAPAAEQKAAFDQAMQLNQTGTQNLTNYYAGQQARAAGYYKPLQDMFTASYGTKGIQAPTTPQGPGKPLAGMYGGG